MPEDGPMAEDRKFHHPLPIGLIVLMIAAGQGASFGARFVLLRVLGVPMAAWLAAAIGVGISLALVELSTRALRK
jgi:hypothetical protein